MDIKIRGLGHDICLQSIDPKTTHLSHLQSFVESKTNLHPSYQRILCNGKTIYPQHTATAAAANEDANSSSNNDDKDDDETLEEIFTKFKIRFKSTSSSCSSTSDDQQVNVSNYMKIKMILMHNASYSKDRLHIECISKLRNELKSIEEEFEQLQRTKGLHVKTNPKFSGADVDVDADDVNNVQQKIKALQHMIIEISCKLDAVDVSTSTSLRSMRKAVLQRVDDLEKQLADFSF